MTQRTRQKSRIPSTISGLLTRDDVNEVLADLESHRADMQDIIVIYTDREGRIYSNHTENTLQSLAVFLLEKEKNFILNGNGEE